MLKLKASRLIPASLLRVSGHVHNFRFLLVREIETGDCYRADHLLVDHLK